MQVVNGGDNHFTCVDRVEPVGGLTGSRAVQEFQRNLCGQHAAGNSR